MIRKGSKEDSIRYAKPPKRRFKGNQFSKRDVEPVGESSSARKLSTAQSDEIVVSLTHSYRIIEFISVFSALTDFVKCKTCNKNVTFAESDHRGLGFKIIISCRCGRRIINSSPFIENGFEVNRRIVFVMRLLGIGREGINLYCNLMDLGKGMSSGAYYAILQHIYDASKVVFLQLRKKAVQEEQAENEKHERLLNNLKVSGDGSWKKRGFSSLYGVTTLIGYYSGKVIDLVVKGAYCQSCTAWKNKENTEEYLLWKERHQDECSANHKGSSGKMEVDAVLEMFGRSEELFGVRYCNYIGDGDSKTFTAILNMNPYGDDFPVTKSECISHVQKRMGSQLRNLKKREKLGGKGKLTDALIKKLTTYYGLAIRRNIESVDDMEKVIMSTYKHLCSTDDKLMHEYCPTGADSWCQWQVAQVTGQIYKHPTPLHADLQKHLLPIYQKLSNRDLLQRCLGGHTQNANESFNSTIWRLAPKHLHCGIQTIEISAFIAAGVFNEGYFAILKIMDVLQLVIGQQAKQYADSYGAARINRQERASLDSSKEVRTMHKMEQAGQQQLFEEAEGLLYGPGIAD